MLDPKYLREQIEEAARSLARRGYKLDIDTFKEFDNKRKQLQIETQNLQNLRNQHSKSIGLAKQKGEDVSALMSEVTAISDKLKAFETQLETMQQAWRDLALSIPNMPHSSVPEGTREEDNQELRRW